MGLEEKMYRRNVRIATTTRRQSDAGTSQPARTGTTPVGRAHQRARRAQVGFAPNSRNVSQRAARQRCVRLTPASVRGI